MATLIGVHWWHVEKIFTKFKLLNVISVQFVDCNLCIMIYYGIAIYELVQNYVVVVVIISSKVSIICSNGLQNAL